MEKRRERSQVILFVAISYAYLWLLFGIERLFDIPFTYDPRQLGGVGVLLGVPASLIAAILATLITREREGLRRLFNRSLEWHFSPTWYLAPLLTPLLVTFTSAIAAVWIDGADTPDNCEGVKSPFGSFDFLTGLRVCF